MATVQALLNLNRGRFCLASFRSVASCHFFNFAKNFCRALATLGATTAMQ